MWQSYRWPTAAIALCGGLIVLMLAWPHHNVKLQDHIPKATQAAPMPPVLRSDLQDQASVAVDGLVKRTRAHGAIPGGPTWNFTQIGAAHDTVITRDLDGHLHTYSAHGAPAIGTLRLAAGSATVEQLQGWVRQILDDPQLTLSSVSVHPQHRKAFTVAVLVSSKLVAAPFTVGGASVTITGIYQASLCRDRGLAVRLAQLRNSCYAIRALHGKN